MRRDARLLQGLIQKEPEIHEYFEIRTNNNAWAQKCLLLGASCTVRGEASGYREAAMSSLIYY